MKLMLGDVTFLCRFRDAYGHDCTVLVIFNRAQTRRPFKSS